ncbi:MAG: hypothetical protein HY282_02735 [Nitrospirae bacterium]|nr:hypothetical protein [Candidatus Manganitrophaceae bacterium]
MKAIPYLFLVILLFSACASGPERKEPEELPKDAVMFPFGYSTAFDRIGDALEAEGYDIAIADKQAGLIQTNLKDLAIAPEGSKLQYHGFYRVHVDGDRDRSWALIQFLVMPELPGEREKLISRIQGESPKTP